MTGGARSHVPVPGAERVVSGLAGVGTGVPTQTDQRPRLVDFFCHEGGATKGYQRAGFHVTGVDIRPQPNYCGDEFIHADAMDLMRDPEFMADFEAAHYSPPCQHHANVTAWRGDRGDHPDLLTPTLAHLRANPWVPYVVENVPEALLSWDLMLCGSQFGLNVRRHRGFIVPWLPGVMLPPCQHHRRLLPFMHKNERAYADAMGCTWISAKSARECIPPAYTEFIGAHLFDHLSEVAA